MTLPDTTDLTATDDRPRSTMRRDIASAYLVTIARIGSWALVSAVVFRALGAEAFGVLVLVRATMGILTYTSFGLGPAMVHALSKAHTDDVLQPAQPVVDESAPVLDYHTPASKGADQISYVATVQATGEFLMVWIGIAAALLATIYALGYDTIHSISPAFTNNDITTLALTYGWGIVFRLASEPSSGLLQARDRITHDNLLQALTEVGWALAVAFTWLSSATFGLPLVGLFFICAQIGLYVSRTVFADLTLRRITRRRGWFDATVARELLAFGAFVVLAQLADFLYAPTDFILINAFISPEAVAAYAPAVQIDAGLLLLVTGVATVLFPKASMAHAAGDVRTLRTYYIRGTLASTALLLFAAIIVWAVSPWLLRWWFGQPMTATLALLPLVLVHTVAGGSSGVGRSVLLGMGRGRAVTVSVLVAGVSNVVLSYLFVRTGWGMIGIVMGTIIVVLARCIVWMPWYVLRALRAGTVPTADVQN